MDGWMDDGYELLIHFRTQVLFVWLFDAVHLVARYILFHGQIFTRLTASKELDKMFETAKHVRTSSHFSYFYTK
jgi:hypothetical protein